MVTPRAVFLNVRPSTGPEVSLNVERIESFTAHLISDTEEWTDVVTFSGRLHVIRMSKAEFEAKLREVFALAQGKVADKIHVSLGSEALHGEPVDLHGLPAPSGPVGSNNGHGHVWARPDGRVSRCGGPALCAQCRADQEAVKAHLPSEGRDA